MGRYTVEPIEGKGTVDRQWGWRILEDDVPYLDCSWGGTGPCWNIYRAERYEGDPIGDGDPMHICDLDDLIAALQTLRESEAYRLNEEQWP